MVVVSVRGMTYHMNETCKTIWDKIKDGKLTKLDEDRVYCVDGRERCLTGDTIIRYNRAALGRKHTLKWMYNQYHDNPDKLPHFKSIDKSIPTFVRSFDGKFIKLNRIKDVVYSGKKEVFLLKLDNGLSIKGSNDHRIMTNEGFIEIQHLIKDKHLVMCDNPHAKKTSEGQIEKHLNRDINISGLHYHQDVLKLDNKKKRIKIHQLIYEANINKLSLREYIKILIEDKEKSSNLKFIDSDRFDIHHKDGNHYNNDLNNLSLITKEEHHKLHASESYINFGQGIPSYSKIESISYAGIEDTYDICCDEPNHNFSANDIIVHNSGKSLWTIQQAAYIDPTILDDGPKGELLPRITFSPEETLKAIRTTKSGKNDTKVIIFDEAFRGLSSKSALSQVNKKLVQALMEMGQSNLVLFIVTPSFFLLEMYPAVLRSNALVHIHKSKRNERRFFRIYNYQKKALLYQIGIRKGWGYHVYTKLNGHFFNKYPGGDEFEARYRRKKLDSLKEASHAMDVPEKVDKYQVRYFKMIAIIKEKLELSGRKAAELLTKSGVEISPTEVIRIHRKVRESGPKP